MNTLNCLARPAQNESLTNPPHTPQLNTIGDTRLQVNESTDQSRYGEANMPRLWGIFNG